MRYDKSGGRRRGRFIATKDPVADRGQRKGVVDNKSGILLFCYACLSQQKVSMPCQGRVCDDRVKKTEPPDGSRKGIYSEDSGCIRSRVVGAWPLAYPLPGLSFCVTTPTMEI